MIMDERGEKGFFGFLLGLGVPYGERSGMRGMCAAVTQALCTLSERLAPRSEPERVVGNVASATFAVGEIRGDRNCFIFSFSIFYFIFPVFFQLNRFALSRKE